MIEPRDAGVPTVTRTSPDASPVGRGDHCIIHTPASASHVDELVAEPHLTAGIVLWTLNHHGSTARARRWITSNGFEFELQIWSGEPIEGREDLCWSQLFASEEALAALSLAKKHQLEAAGWREDIEATVIE
jgi:hypothetical protein